MTEVAAEHFKDWTFEHWQYLHGKPSSKAQFKLYPEDFIVTEILGYELTGEGENLYLLIEKSQLNTQQVCEYLAKYFGKRLRDIGYAGSKDKQSISRQWFSVQMNVKQSFDLTDLNSDGIKLIESKRHNKKLKVGALLANHFEIKLRDVSEPSTLEQRLERVKEQGVPNYFGMQRFGFKGNNLNWANRMASGEVIKNKKIKGFALSASRSYIFNQIVSKRIEQNAFSEPMLGDVYMLAGSNSFFSDSITPELIERLKQQDIQISAALIGKGEFATSEQALELEQTTAVEFESWLDMLAEHGLKQERRAIKLQPLKLSYEFKNKDMDLSFMLPSGCFATSVLRECVQWDELNQ